MWLGLITFLLVSSVCFGILTLFMRSGSNREADVATARGRRPLVFGPLTQPLAGIFPMRAETRQRYSRFLHQAGHYHAQAMIEYLALRNALVLGSVLVTLAAIVAGTQPGEPAMYWLALGGMLVMVLAFAMPRLVLETMAKSRARRIEEDLPDALDMITMCVSAGLPLQQAISRVSQETRSSHPDPSFELRIVGRHTETGSLGAAIQHFAKRLDVPEIHSVAAMVRQADHQGGTVVGAFQAFSDQVRLNRKQRAEEAGNKTAFKMLFPLVFCLAPAVYLVLLGPAIADLREFFRRESEAGGILTTSADSVDSLVSQPAIPPESGTSPSGITTSGGTP